MPGYRTERTAHGHAVAFTGGPGSSGIDVGYDGQRPIDRICTYSYAAGESTQLSREDFDRFVEGYLADLTAEDAHLHASGGRKATR